MVKIIYYLSSGEKVAYMYEPENVGKIRNMVDVSIGWIDLTELAVLTEADRKLIKNDLVKSSEIIRIVIAQPDIK